MNWNELIALRLSELVVKQLAEAQKIELKDAEENIRKEIEMEVQKNFQEEKELTEEVYKTMEELESQGHQFERQKMFPLLKKQLAKKKGIIL